jgi:hypothetical protein
MKLLTKILTFTLLPLALFAALPPTAEDLREMRTIVDSPVLNQILYPEERVFFIGKDPEETERSVYILESTSHTIGVVVSHNQPATQKPGFVGPLPIQLQFYAIENELPEGWLRGSIFKEMFSSSEPVVAEEGGSPSQDLDLVKIRAILNAPDLYSELDGARVEYIVRSHYTIEELRNEEDEELVDGFVETIKPALDNVSLEKSGIYQIVASYPNTETKIKIAAFVLYPEDSDTPTILFFTVPDDDVGE